MAFALFDADSDGCVTGRELRLTMATLGFSSDDVIVTQMLDKFVEGDDDDEVEEQGEGVVEIDEFMLMMSRRNYDGVSKGHVGVSSNKNETVTSAARNKPREPPHWKAFKVGYTQVV